MAFGSRDASDLISMVSFAFTIRCHPPYSDRISAIYFLSPPEMRGYQFLISASYPYPSRTICIRILSVQTLLTAIRILSVSVPLTASPKYFPRHFRLYTSFNTGCQILIPPVVFGKDVDVAYFLVFPLCERKSARFTDWMVVAWSLLITAVKNLSVSNSWDCWVSLTTSKCNNKVT